MSARSAFAAWLVISFVGWLGLVSAIALIEPEHAADAAPTSEPMSGVAPASGPPANSKEI